MNDVLIVAQVIPQWYVDIMSHAIGPDAHIQIITGSHIQGDVIPSPAYQSTSLRSRLFSWYRHARFMKTWAKQNRHRKYDLIFAVSNPPINARIGLKLKKIFGAPFIYMNWDLYPQVIRLSIKNPVAQWICSRWDRWNSQNYPKIDRMLTLGETMSASLLKPLQNKIPVEVIPVAADTDQLKPINKLQNPFCLKHKLADKFVVLYSGKMGLGHNVELILDAAAILKDETGIQFVFIGEGPKYMLVQKFIKDNDSQNILLLPWQPDELFPQSMACGDIGIVSQETSLAHLFMPSKAYSMMACGEAIVGICTEHDDLYKLITSEQTGIAVTEHSPDILAETILELFRNHDQLQTYQRKAREAAVGKFSMSTIQYRYEKVFSSFLTNDIDHK